VIASSAGFLNVDTSYAIAEVPILRSLPSDVQKRIEGIRQSCRESPTGDKGLVTFTVSGTEAILIDELNFCGDGAACKHGVNCATGYPQLVEVYVRSGSTWRKSFSKYVTEPMFLKHRIRGVQGAGPQSSVELNDAHFSFYRSTFAEFEPNGPK
jgi:hypothetical protein